MPTMRNTNISEKVYTFDAIPVPSGCGYVPMVFRMKNDGTWAIVWHGKINFRSLAEQVARKQCERIERESRQAMRAGKAA